MRPPRRQYPYHLFALLIIVGGFIFWQSDLTSDPPMYYEGLGQSLSTDPAQYVFHARNAILFDDPDPYDYPRWTVYHHSLVSLVSYVWFAVAGESLRDANLVGVLLSMAALLFFLLALTRHHRPWVYLVASVCFIMNVTLFTYGRLSYLENGLIFLSALVVFVYSWWGNRWWGVALSGALVALATLTGKLFGALLLPALVAAIVLSRQGQVRRRTAPAVVAFLLTAVVVSVLLYGRDVRAAFAYVGEQSYGLRGFPDGLRSPWAFVEHVISYGFTNHLFYLDIDLLLFWFFGLLLLVLFLSSGRKIGELSPPTVFSMFVIIAAILGLAPLNYSPLRYGLLVIAAIILFCFGLFDTMSNARVSTPVRLNKGPTVILTLALWVLLFHAIGNIFFGNTFPRPIRSLTWATLPGSIVLAFVSRRVIGRYHFTLTRRKLTIGAAMLACFSIIFNGYQIRRQHLIADNYNIMEANQDLQAILSPEAVVSGPYGPVLTLNTPLKSFIHLFQVADLDSTLFDRQPITHIAADESNWAEAIAAYPVLKDLVPVTAYWIRDVEVMLYNISNVFSNEQARSYRPSEFEQAQNLFQRSRLDSALTIVERFVSQHPESKSGGLLRADLVWQQGKYSEAYQHLARLADRFPTDFHIQLQCGRALQLMAGFGHDRSLEVLANQYYECAVKVNPFKAQYARQLWAQTAAMLEQAPQR
ncbi:MAG TPA: hypothetical protein VN285_08585 [Candidatus Deferrimicrobium sp.]|nr:hypothetical protein [Candidatus Deferrimicrobium sp.]